MASVINKRQQARNERALQDLIRNVPGNDRCADCNARNPGWASWSLGLFLCMRCAALHRKLGTHLSKVKSLSMDSWTSDQVENMKKIGNVASNRQYNPKNVKPNLPLDADEIDIAMEKYIRQKYQHRNLGSDGVASPVTHNTGSTSSEDHPPAVPPKPAPRFATSTRAASSQYPTSPTERPLPPIVAGAPNGRKGSFDEKMHALKEMGFPDERRNATVLKGLDGNVEKTVETLARLEDGGRTIKSTTRGVAGAKEQSGLKLNTQGSSSAKASPLQDGQASQPSSRSAPVSAAIASHSQNASPMNSTNPFNIPPNQSPASMEQAMQNMQISGQNQYQYQPQQQQQPAPLFPNSTGTYQQQTQHNPFLKTFTPPISPSPYQYSSQASQGIYSNSPTQYAPSNPFLRQSRSQVFNSTNPFDAAPQQSLAHNMYQQDQSLHIPPVPPMPPWMQGERSMSEPQLNNSPQQPLQSPNYSPSQFQTTSPSHNPYLATTNSQPMNLQQNQYQGTFAQPGFQQQHPQQQQHFNQPHQLQSQPTGRFDKNSILALYNQPSQPSPPPMFTQDSTQVQTPQRSATMPDLSASQPRSAAAAYTSHNPFANTGPAVGQQNSASPAPPHPTANGASYASRESIDFSGFMSGRHSPDAFASLSSRFS